jgi:hypothetical protein
MFSPETTSAAPKKEKFSEQQLYLHFPRHVTLKLFGYFENVCAVEINMEKRETNMRSNAHFFLFSEAKTRHGAI